MRNDPSSDPTNDARSDSTSTPTGRPGAGERVGSGSPPPGAAPYGDEISLRELYLVLRRHAGAIVGVALAVGVATFLAISLRAPSYQARAVVQVAPLEIPGEESDAAPPERVDLEGYRAVARSAGVGRAVADALAERGFDAENVAEALASERRGELDALGGSDATSLLVAHLGADPDPELAAALTGAWTDATLRALRSGLVDDYQRSADVARERLQERLATLEEVREASEAFRSRDERDFLRERLQAIGSERNQALRRLDQIASQLAASSARQALLRAQLGDAPDGDPLTQLRALQESELIDESTVQQLELLLERSETNDNDLLELVRRTALQRELIDSAGVQAERDALREQLDALRAESETVRGDVARLTTEAERLERDLEQATDAYRELENVPERAALTVELLATTGRVVDPAEVPAEPQPNRRSLLALVATILTGAAAILFVLLREAVREPDDAAS